MSVCVCTTYVHVYNYQGVLSGILRGAGYQFRGAIINIVAYYVFGLPIGITLTLAADMGALGMWIGLTIATITQTICFSVILLCSNWSKESEKAMKRAGKVKNGPRVTVSEPLELIQYNQNDDNESDGIVEKDDHLDVPLEQRALSVVADVDDDIGDDTTALVDSSEQSTSVKDVNGRIKSRIKLISCHISLVVIACVCLVVSGILSMYHPPDSIVNGNYSDNCTDINDTIAL